MINPKYRIIDQGVVVAVMKPVTYVGFDELDREGIQLDVVGGAGEFLFDDCESAFKWFLSYDKIRHGRTFVDIEA